MGQEEITVSIGDVLDELGITLPASDEQQATEQSDESTVTDAETVETTTETTEDPEESVEETQDAEAGDESTESQDNTDSEEEDPDAEADDDTQERGVKKLSRRVDKLTARAKSAEEQAASLQAELAATKEQLVSAQPIILQDSVDPLSDVLTPEDLDSKLNSAHIVIDQVPDLIAKSDMEGGEIEVPMGNGSVQKFTTAQLRERLQAAKAILRSEPQRRQFLSQRGQFIAEAKQVYPELFQDGSQPRAMLLQTLQAYPGIARLPNLELIIGDAIRGQAQRFAQYEALQKKTAPAKTAKPVSKQVVAPKVVSPSSAPKTKAKPNVIDALRKNGSRENAEALIGNLLGE